MLSAGASDVALDLHQHIDHNRFLTLIGLCNYGGLIDTLFTDVEGVA
jgi:hypothetical protein